MFCVAHLEDLQRTMKLDLVVRCTEVRRIRQEDLRKCP